VCELDPDKQEQLATMNPKGRFTETIDHVLADPEVGGVTMALLAETQSELVSRALLGERKCSLKSLYAYPSRKGRSS
jgi:hypothetical protein